MEEYEQDLPRKSVQICQFWESRDRSGHQMGLHRKAGPRHQRRDWGKKTPVVVVAEMPLLRRMESRLS
ncbi:MAG TPA: hypothetical protein DHW02_24580, partial [Ktedonobacter sp.]|nr:hypothetical protein [Ktedonobacter sp.]